LQEKHRLPTFDQLESNPQKDKKISNFLFIKNLYKESFYFLYLGNEDSSDGYESIESTNDDDLSIKAPITTSKILKGKSVENDDPEDEIFTRRRGKNT
jgi:hypothetical protein